FACFTVENPGITVVGASTTTPYSEPDLSLSLYHFHEDQAHRVDSAGDTFGNNPAISYPLSKGTYLVEAHTRNNAQIGSFDFYLSQNAAKAPHGETSAQYAALTPE